MHTRHTANEHAVVFYYYEYVKQRHQSSYRTYIMC